MKITYEQLKAAQQTRKAAEALYDKIKSSYVKECEHLEIGVPYYDQKYCCICRKEARSDFWESLKHDPRRKWISAA